MPGRILEVDTPSAVIGIDLIRQGLPWIGPVIDTTLENASVNHVEAAVIDEECIVLQLNLSDIRFGELDKHSVLVRHDCERPKEWALGVRRVS